MLISFWFSSPFCNSQCLKNTKWWFVRTLYFNFNVLRYRRLGHSCSFYSTRLMLNQCWLTVILEYWFPLRSGCSRTSHFTWIKLFVHKKTTTTTTKHSIVKSLAKYFSVFGQWLDYWPAGPFGSHVHFLIESSQNFDNDDGYSSHWFVMNWMFLDRDTTLLYLFRIDI